MNKWRPLLKTIAYAAASLLLIGFSARWQAAMRPAEQMETGFFRALYGAFLIACALIGVALYVYVGFVRKRKAPYRADVLFLLLTGLALLGLTVGCFWRYGGLSGTFAEDGYVAANFMVVTLSLLPLPFLCRMAVTALSREETRVGVRRAMGIAALCLWILYAALVIAGALFHTVVYTAG